MNDNGGMPEGQVMSQTSMGLQKWEIRITVKQGGSGSPQEHVMYDECEDIHKAIAIGKRYIRAMQSVAKSIAPLSLTVSQVQI